ncbi:MAG: hypothetical protein AAFQ36_00315 [Pseudomonadota bacterium]
MSERAPPTDYTRIFAVLLLVAVMGIGVFAWLQRNSGDLDSSATGFRGLFHMLQDEDLAVRWYVGYGDLFAEDIGLWVIPLFDTSPGAQREVPETGEEWLFNIDERDRTAIVFGESTRDMRPVFILPKWRSGVRLTGKAHPELLIPEARIEALLESMRLRDVRISRGESAEDQVTQTDGLELHYRQSVRSTNCTGFDPEDRGNRVILMCWINAFQRFYLIPDPDLLSNHGLAQGENASIALGLLEALRGEGDIVIDRSDGFRIVQRRAPMAEPRDLTDWARFLEPPFPLIWTALVGMAILSLWRGAIRGAEPVVGYGRAPETARSVARGARARLMALSGNGAEVAKAYAQARILTLERRIFGPQGAGGRSLFDSLAARDPSSTSALRAALEQINALDSAAPTPQVVAATDRFDAALREILRDT